MSQEVNPNKNSISITESVIPPGKTVKQGQKVVTHPLKEWIDRLIKSGESPKTVSEWLKTQHPKETQISEKTIYNYIKNFIPTWRLLPAPYYKEKLLRLDRKIDALKALYSLAISQAEKVAIWEKLESESNIELPNGLRSRQLLQNMLVNILKTEMDLGIRAKAADKLEIESRQIDIDVLLVELRDKRKKAHESFLEMIPSE